TSTTRPTADKIAALVALQLEITSIDDELGAFLDTVLDITFDFIEQLARDHRPVIYLRVAGRSDLQSLDAWNEFLHQRAGRLFADWDGDRYRHATLPGGAVAGANQGIHGLIHVGVGHHDHVVLGAAKTLHAFAVRRAGGENVLRDRGRTDEADRSYARIGEQHVDRFLVAVDDVEHALRQPSFEKQFGDAQRHRRIALRRF